MWHHTWEALDLKKFVILFEVLEIEARALCNISELHPEPQARDSNTIEKRDVTEKKCCNELFDNMSSNFHYVLHCLSGVLLVCVLQAFERDSNRQGRQGSFLDPRRRTRERQGQDLVLLRLLLTVS